MNMLEVIILCVCVSNVVVILIHIVSYVVIYCGLAFGVNIAVCQVKVNPDHYDYSNVVLSNPIFVYIYICVYYSRHCNYDCCFITSETGSNISRL